jgi:hypothetical protein
LRALSASFRSILVALVWNPVKIAAMMPQGWSLNVRSLLDSASKGGEELLPLETLVFEEILAD